MDFRRSGRSRSASSSTHGITPSWRGAKIAVVLEFLAAPAASYRRFRCATDGRTSCARRIRPARHAYTTVRQWTETRAGAAYETPNCWADCDGRQNDRWMSVGPGGTDSGAPRGQGVRRHNSAPSGGVAEWLNALVLKTSRAARLSWVRILPPPPRLHFPELMLRPAR